MSQSIRVFAPAHHLPAEGADPDFSAGSPEEISALLSAYASVFRESPLAFRVSSCGSVRADDTEGAEEFLPFSVGVNGGEGVGFSQGDELGAISVNLAEAAGEVTVAADSDGALRELSERLAAKFRGNIMAAGEVPVPLMRWHENGGGDGGVAQLLGVWIAGEEQVAEVRESPGGAEIVFGAGDVEGHGVRQTLATFAVLGVMLGGSAKSEAGFLFFKSKSERDAERKAKVEATSHGRQASAEIDRDVIAKAKATTVRVIVDVSKQRAYLVAADGEILISTPVSTARAGKYTPRGEFTITQRVRTGKTSTIYGCALPYWMRLGESAIGLHVGDLPGYPASAGCVRLPANVAPVLFDATRSGTKVMVVNSWNGGDSGLIAAR